MRKNLDKMELNLMVHITFITWSPGRGQRRDADDDALARPVVSQFIDFDEQ